MSPKHKKENFMRKLTQAQRANLVAIKPFLKYKRKPKKYIEEKIISSKACSICKKEKPATPEFFDRKTSGVNGLNNICKICKSNIRKKKNAHSFKFCIQTKRGNSKNEIVSKFCSDCGRIFPVSSIYFPFDKKTKDGLSAKCRQCSKKIFKTYNEKNKKTIKEKEKKRRKKNKKNISEYLKKWRKKNKEYGKKYSKEYTKKNRKKISEKSKIFRENNREKLKKRAKEQYQKHREKIIKKNKMPQEYNSLFLKLKPYEKIRQDPKNPGLGQAKCAYCNKWINPTHAQTTGRLKAINNKGGLRFYCNNNNDNCKISCPIYNQWKFPKGFRPATSREANPLLRQLVLKRDNYTCQHCGATIEEAPLHCHHVVPARQNPMTANDPSVCVTLCKSCHITVHKTPGCTYQELKCSN